MQMPECKIASIGQYQPKALGVPGSLQSPLPRGKMLVLTWPRGQNGFESFIISITLIFDRVVCLKGDCNHFKFISRL